MRRELCHNIKDHKTALDLLKQIRPRPQAAEVPAGLDMTTKAVERNAEATGGDITSRERAVIGQAYTRDVKIGCAFTQTTCNKEGYPIRDPGSTTYVVAVEAA